MLTYANITFPYSYLQAAQKSLFGNVKKEIGSVFEIKKIGSFPIKSRTDGSIEVNLITDTISFTISCDDIDSADLEAGTIEVENMFKLFHTWLLPFDAEATWRFDDDWKDQESEFASRPFKQHNYYEDTNNDKMSVNFDEILGRAKLAKDLPDLIAYMLKERERIVPCLLKDWCKEYPVESWLQRLCLERLSPGT